VCTDECGWNERMWLAWFRWGLWKRRGKRRNADKGRCRLCNEDENLVLMLLKCNETQR
jgi:hypothetical protein